MLDKLKVIWRSLKINTYLGNYFKNVFMQVSLESNIQGTLLNILIIYYELKMHNDKFYP
jgi:hypothetical protein